MKNQINPMSVAFYVAPYVNAIVRRGTMQEKEIVFQSMLKFKAFEKIPSNKRGHKPGEMEQLYIQAMRTVTNVKNRQTRAQDAGMAYLEQMIEENNLLDNKVLLFLLEPGKIDKNIAGLVANKMMAKYQRPCCILTRVEDISGGEMIMEDGTGVIKFAPSKIRVSYQGSARGCDKAGVTNFKEICEKTGCIMFAEGHQGAFGLGIYSHTVGVDDEVAGDNILQFLERTNEALSDISDEAIYYVDYIYDNINVNPQHIEDIARYPELWGKDIDEPFVAIKGLKITKDMITLMSPDKSPTIKITLPNGVSLIKFNSSEEEFSTLFSEQGYIEVDIVGRCGMNERGYKPSPQIYIEDYEIIGRMKYVF
jgi:single-stranded-DNA-specific exonuclease